MTSPFEESILTSLRRISRAIDMHSRQLARESGLTVPQLVCLRYLAHAGPSAPTVLARKVSLSPATVTGILDRLARRDLILRRRLTQDRRRVEVCLTDRGRDMVKGAPSPLQSRFAKNLAELEEAQQREIDRTLHQVVRMMEAQELDAAPLLATGPPLANPKEIEEFLRPKPD